MTYGIFYGSGVEEGAEAWNDCMVRREGRGGERS